VWRKENDMLKRGWENFGLRVTSEGPELVAISVAPKSDRPAGT